MTHPVSRSVSRRGLLAGLTGAFTLGRSSLAFATAATDRRFVAITLRGGLDGMALVVPYGDRNLSDLRATLVPPPPGAPNGMLDLDGFFALHPAMTGLHALYRAREAAIVHAVAGPYRNRSHFDAQDFLESGADRRLGSGWLNRLAGLLPKRGESDAAVAVGSSVPLLLRGPTPVNNWAPPVWPEPSLDFVTRLVAMHRGDPVTGPAFAAGLRDRGFTAAVLNGVEPPPNAGAFVRLADRAGRLLAAHDGPRLATLDSEGWDTHGGQVARLSFGLRTLDDGLAALKTALGPIWAKTVVLVMSEFGRTARVNGAGGTDHGTGGIALLLGGAVAGGRIIGDWPGLAPGQLFEDRDLRGVTDLRSVAKGIAAAHYNLDQADRALIFPDSGSAGPLMDILRA